MTSPSDHEAYPEAPATTPGEMNDKALARINTLCFINNLFL